LGRRPRRDAARLSGDLVDSSVWIDFFNGRSSREADLLALLLRRRILLTGDLILAEVLRGFRDDHHMGQARRALLGLPHADMVGQEVALATAQSHRLLRQRGITIRKTIDVMLATFCIGNGHVLLHADRDFEPMIEHPGLRTA
jgi:predicted nucleic acid-binding protein